MWFVMYFILIFTSLSKYLRWKSHQLIKNEKLYSLILLCNNFISIMNINKFNGSYANAHKHNV